MPRELAPVVVDEVLALARWRSHVLVVWKQAADAQRAERVAAETVRAVRSHTGVACHIAWVLPTAAAPTAEARNVFAKMGRDVGAALCCMAAVVGDDGFSSAVFRAAITGIAMAARIQFPLKLAGDVNAAARWAAERADFEAEPLVTALTALRDRT